MSEKHLVCQGAVCQCIFGTAPDTLKVKTQKKHFINDLEGEEKLIATDQDLGKTLENNTFGSCAKLDNNPCQVMITEWSGFYDKVTLEANGGHPLLEDSKATCPIGGKGCISITHHGQSCEVGSQSLNNARPEVLTELCPFFDFTDTEESEQNENEVKL